MISQRGNVLFILLIGVAIFAALSYAVSQGMRLGEGTVKIVTEDKAKLDASAVMDFFQAIKDGYLQMKMNGVSFSSVDFVAPGEAGYTTAPHDFKIFHSEGGGVPYVAVWSSLDDPAEATATEWTFISNAIDGVGGSGNESIVALVRVPEKICAQLNLGLTGSDAIPNVSGSMGNMFVTAADPITAANCAACENKKMMCVANGTVRAFYYVLDRG